MIHNAYQYSKEKIIELLENGEDGLELDVISGCFGIPFVAHSWRPFGIFTKGYFHNWLSWVIETAEKLEKKIKLGIEFKSYSKKLADNIGEFLYYSNLKNIDIVVLKPAKNWFYKDSRKKIAEYFFEKFSKYIKITKVF